MKICSKCKISKELNQFYKNKKDKSGVGNYCKRCDSDRRKLWHQNNKERIWNYHITKKYGLCKLDYNKLLLTQNGCCAICKRPPTTQTRKKKLCIDHDHKTGIIRGLLCCDCNTAIGKFKDNLALLDAAIKYLKLNRS